MNIGPEYGLIAILFVWCLILTFLFLRFYLYTQRISKGSKKQSIIDILDNVLSREQELRKEIEVIGREVEGLSSDSHLYIQKVGLVRFNPFNDTGGDQSFILALVDGENSGVVISGLHTRSGTRWYAKKVESGKGVEYQLSEDEERAIKSATRKQVKRKE